MADVGAWSTTDGENTTEFGENQKPSQVNDSFRGVMGGIARFFNDTNGSLSAGGSSSAYTLATNAGFANTAQHSLMVARFPLKAVGSSTFNVDGLGAKDLTRNGGALTDSGIPANSLAIIAHNATRDKYEVISPDNAATENMDLLAEGTVISGAALTVSGIPAKYKSAVIMLADACCDGNGLQHLRMQIGSTGALQSGANDYAYTMNSPGARGTGVALVVNGDTGTSSLGLMIIGSSASALTTTHISIQGLNDAKSRPRFQFSTRWNPGNNNREINAIGSGCLTTQVSANAFSLFWIGAGNFADNGGGQYRVYGMT